MNAHPIRIAALGAAMLLAAGCTNSGVAPRADSTAPSPAVATPALIALPRALSPAERGVLSASNLFSLALWQRITTSARDSNVFVSPLSASFALGMALNGAAGQTFDQMRTALQLGTQPLADIDTGYTSLIALLTSLDPVTTMWIANSIWYDRRLPVNQGFLNDGTRYFGARIAPLDFTDVTGSVKTINDWVSTQTKGRIPTILDTIDPAEVMFLINAIYFKGTWREKFDAALTESAPFHAVGGDQPARLMHREGHISYASSPTYQAVDLPYGDSAFTMTVLLPAAGTSVETLAASLTDASWQAVVTSLRPALVDLRLPKLTLSWERDLIPDLAALGMRLPFITDADFSRLSSVAVQVDKVKQKTFVTVDETGTEAAAVTAVGVVATSAQLPVEVRVDRPYLFVIRERLSGTVLFMGKIVRLP